MKAKCAAAVCALMLVWAAAASAQNGWQPVTSPATGHLRGLDFTSALCGTVVGENSTILRTTDGGQTWTPQTGPADEWFMAVSFATDSVALICGTSGTILFTQNAGAHWNTVQTGWMTTYHGAHQRTATAGIVAGVNTIFAPLVAYTSNGWQNLTPGTFYLMDPNQVSNEGTLYDVQMLTADVWVAVAHVWDGHGAICRTTNGGQTWSTVYWTTGSLLAVDFPTSDIGYAVGVSGLQLKSTDGGASWTTLGNPLRINWWDVDFVSADTGWVVGENQSIYRTDNGGDSWRGQHSGAGYLYGVKMVDSRTGYVVGENGLILRTTTGGDDVNLPPSPFVRLLPADSSVDPFEEIPTVRFVWSRSSDPDGNGVGYRLRAFIPAFGWENECTTGDTTCALDVPVPLRHLDELYAVRWTVTATDGIDTVAAANGEGVFFIDAQAADEPAGVVRELALVNHPNPFNARTTLVFSIPRSSPARVRVFDLLGRERFVRDLGTLAAGGHELDFDARTLASGVYIARLETTAGAVNRKLVLLR